MSRDWRVIEHRFGSEATLAVQRFALGPGARRFTFKKSSLTFAERLALINFWNAVQGSYQTFLYDVPNPDRSTYTSYTVVFETQPLSIEHLATMCRVGFTLVEIVSTAPSYSVSATVVRFPNSTLTTALLSQTQQIIPLLHIKVRDPAVPDVYLSDRRCTVAGQLYLPRVLSIGESGTDTIFTQQISGAADTFQFTLGNADRAMSAFVQDTTLKYASIDLCLYHVQTGILLQLWKGTVQDWYLDGSAPFTLRGSDGLFPMTQNYPRRTIGRQCWKTFNVAPGCPYSTVHPSGTSTTCDYFFDSAGGCLFNGMSPYFGGQPAMPQLAVIKDDGTGVIFGFGRSTVTTTSIVSDSIWDQPLSEIWCNDLGNPQSAFWANCIVAAVRDESTFEDVLGIVGAGPIGQYEGMSVQTNANGYQFLVCPLADGFPPQGFVVNGQYQVTRYQPTMGLRQVLGTDPASLVTDPFSLGSLVTLNGVAIPMVGQNYSVPDPGFSNQLTGVSGTVLPMAAGVAFVELRYSKSPGTGIAPTTAESHTMTVPLSAGLEGVIFDASGNPSTVPGLVNNAWVAMNVYFRALGLDKATTAEQLAAIVLPSINKGDGSGAAEICGLQVPPVLGTGVPTYTLTASGIAIAGNINTTTATFSYATVMTIDDAVSAGYIELVGGNLYSLTYTGLAQQGQVTNPTTGGVTNDGFYSYPTTMALSAALSAGYVAPGSTSGYETQFMFQGTIAEFKPVRDWLVAALNSCLGYFTFEFGALKLGIRENASATTSFGLGNTLFQSLAVSPAEGKFEYLKLDFANVALQYQMDFAQYQDKDYSAYMGRPGCPLTSRMRSPGCSTISQGLRIAATRVREEIGGILRPDCTNPYVEFDNNHTITFKTTILALGTEVGDVIEVTHPDLPTYPGPVGGSASPAHTWKYRIVKWTLHKDWSITIQAKSVTDSMYDLDVGPKPADVATLPLPILFYPEPLGEWAPYQVQANGGDAIWPGEWTFDVVQTYTLQQDGSFSGGVTAGITAKLPVNRFIPGCTPPSVKAGQVTQAATGGSLLGGTTYRIQVCAVNAAGVYSPPSEIVIVPVPAGTNTNQVTLAGIIWPQIVGLTGYVVFAADNDDLICGQQTGALTQIATEPYAYTPASITISGPFNRQTYGVPNPNITTVRAKGKRLIHAGPVGALVDSVSSCSIVSAECIDVAATDNWVGRDLVVVGRAPQNGSAPFISYPIVGFVPSTGAFTLSVDPTGTVLPGDIFAVSFLGYDNSATPTVLTDAGISNGTNPTPHTGEATNDPNRIGNYVRAVAGQNRGAVAKIVSNTATAYTLDRPFLIGASTRWIVETAAWETSIDLALDNSDPLKSTALQLPVGNYPNLPVLVALVAVDQNGDESDESNAPLRMLWISGAGGTYNVTGAVTQSPFHTGGTLIFTGSGSNSLAALSPQTIPNGELTVRNAGSGAVPITLPGGFTFQDTGTATMSLAANSTVRLKFPASGTVVIPIGSGGTVAQIITPILTGSSTLITTTAPTVDGQQLFVRLIQATGGNNVTWDTIFDSNTPTAILTELGGKATFQFVGSGGIWEYVNSATF